MEDQEPRDADEGDQLEAAIMQTDHAFGAESVGTTAEEGLRGESLDQPSPRSNRSGRPWTSRSRSSTKASTTTRASSSEKR